MEINMSEKIIIGVIGKKGCVQHISCTSDCNAHEYGEKLIEIWKQTNKIHEFIDCAESFNTKDQTFFHSYSGWLVQKDKDIKTFVSKHQKNSNTLFFWNGRDWMISETKNKDKNEIAIFYKLKDFLKGNNKKIKISQMQNDGHEIG